MAQRNARHFLPSDLGKEYEELVELLAKNETGPAECAQFIVKVERTEGVKTSVVQYLVMDIRDRFISDYEAMVFLQERLQILEGRTEKSEEVDVQLIDVYSLLADIAYWKNSRMEETEMYYQKIRTLIDENKDELEGQTRTGKAAILSRLAHLDFRMRSGTEKGHQFSEEALELLREYFEREEIPDSLLDPGNMLAMILAFVALGTLADLHCRKKTLVGLEQLFELALPFAEKYDLIEEHRVLQWLIRINSSLKRANSVLKYGRRALAIVQELVNYSELSAINEKMIRRVIAHHLRGADDMFWSKCEEESIFSQQELLSLAKRRFGDDDPAVARVAASLALSLYKHSPDKSYVKYQKIAESCLESAIRFSQQGNVSFFDTCSGIELIKTCLQLGTLHLHLREFDISERYYKKGLEWSEMADCVMQSKSIWLKKLGILYYNWRKYDQAIKYISEYIELLRKIRMWEGDIPPLEAMLRRCRWQSR